MTPKKYRMNANLSRRSFIGTAAVGAAALGMSGLVQAKKIPGVDGPKHGASLIGAVKLNPTDSYFGVPELLQTFIQSGQTDEESWERINEKIDYTYDCLDEALEPLFGGKKEKSWTALRQNILMDINNGKKLFFKPNCVNLEVLSLAGDGSPGLTTGVLACTDWAFLAALMRWFHDKLGIQYYQMAVGEATPIVPSFASLIGCTSEAILEGLPFGPQVGYWAGYPFIFVRKYLAEKQHSPEDNPMNGYMDSILGNYVTPMHATEQGKLIMYDLNNAERFDRGREIQVPDYPQGNYQSAVIHKVIVGDPNDPGNYPGCVLINCPILKVHNLTSITNAIKNLGIGCWPACAGHDNDPGTQDWMYAYPPDFPPGMKGGEPGHHGSGHGVYHDKWYAVEVNHEGIPLEITDTPNFGLDGTMVDINLAIKTQVNNVVHVTDAIKIVDIEHGGSGYGQAREEGLVFASVDPVALDLFCSRYMFKNIPKDYVGGAFIRGVPIPRWDPAQAAIITDPGYDDRISRTLLFDYAEERNLGQKNYYVNGKDKTTVVPAPLVSKDGHFGKINLGNFVEMITNEFYFHQANALWDLQPMILAYAQATDQLTQAFYGYNPGYYGEFMALDENGDGMIDDLEFGREGMVDCTLACGGISFNYIGKGEVHHGNFLLYSKAIKYAEAAWNGSIDITRIYADGYAFSAAFQMAMEPEVPGVTVDPFFGIPYGTGADGIPKWPSLQFARYGLEIIFIYDYMYLIASEYAAATGKTFVLYVPVAPPYFPYVDYNPDGIPTNPYGIIVATADPAKIFTAEFSDGEVW